MQGSPQQFPQEILWGMNAVTYDQVRSLLRKGLFLVLHPNIALRRGNRRGCVGVPVQKRRMRAFSPTYTFCCNAVRNACGRGKFIPIRNFPTVPGHFMPRTFPRLFSVSVRECGSMFPDCGNLKLQAIKRCSVSRFGRGGGEDGGDGVGGESCGGDAVKYGGECFRRLFRGVQEDEIACFYAVQSALRDERRVAVAPVYSVARPHDHGVS